MVFNIGFLIILLKNDMDKFIESLIKKFNKNDLENIYAMKFFNYIKMNEMY